MKKRFLSMCLVFVLVVMSLTGCGKDGQDKEPTGAVGTPEATPTEAETPEATPTEEPKGTPEATPTEEPGVPDGEKYEMDAELTALELVTLMGNGINLGNTMEAYGRASFGPNLAPGVYEKFWGQPITTKEMIQGMKDAGFDTLRIPVAWTNAMAYEDGDYTINQAYIDRVEEIINYALDADMYVIVNDHWDGSWWGMFGSATPEIRDKAMEMYISMWTQLATAYKDYGTKLIFEGANEELGDRLNDKDVCPDSGTLSKDECYKTLVKITQAFVDTVRATGGNNATRFLLIPGYNTDIMNTCDNRYQMPKDTVENRLLISVHFYTPWGYCGNASLGSWGHENEIVEQNDLIKMMTKFSEQGYGVVIGEYAVAFNSDGTVKHNTDVFFTNFLNNCDVYNFCPVLWDCNGLYNKTSMKVIDEALADIFASRDRDAESKRAPEEITAEAEKEMADLLANASEGGGVSEDTALAWIMYNSEDWTVMSSVGDVYDANSVTYGVEVTNAEITGAGTYTVGLDFTGLNAGYAQSTAFMALGLTNGETLYPGYVIHIKEILINGEPYEMKGKPYTTSDDGVCSRVNLYNGWITGQPNGGRTPDGSLVGATAQLLDPEELGKIETITVTFSYIKK